MIRLPEIPGGAPPYAGEAIALAVLAVALSGYARWRRAWANYFPGAPRARWRIAAALGGLALLAAARLGREPEAPSRPRRLMVVIDSSGSMAADDLRPSRFAAALAEAGELVSRSGEAEIGLVELNGAPRVVLPPTPDRARVQEALSSLGALPPGGGSDLDAALALAAGYLVPDGGRIAAFTDGERDRSPIARLPLRLRQRDIRLELFGAGTPEGVALPGKPQPARLEEDVLLNMAEENGGRYTRLGVPPGSASRRPPARVPLPGRPLAMAALALLAIAGWRGAPW